MMLKEQKTSIIEANRTRRLLDYLAKKDIERYRALIAKLGLRK